MRKVGFFIAILLLGGFAFSQEMGDVSTANNETPRVEVSTNLLGVFLGSYTGRLEIPVVSDGFLALGVFGTYFNQTLLGIDMEGYEAFADFRIYPKRETRGIYFGAEGGYTSFTYGNEDGDSFSLSSIPIMALVGYKWVINKISLDLGFATGKQIYIGDYDSDTEDLINSFPLNFSYDIFFLIGYRF